MYMQLIEELKIELENQNFTNKPIAFEKQVGFPYHDLQSRDFERLIYCIFKQEINQNKSLRERYDNIQLMQGVGERGRDCVLLKAGLNSGVIQCKRYKNNIDKPEVGKEIIKFLLHYTQDNRLIANLDYFTYLIVVSYGFSEKALDFINSLTDRTYDKREVEDWAKGIIKGTEGLKTVVYDDVKDKLYDALDKITFEKMIPDDINSIIEKYQEIKVSFFDIKAVIDTRHFETLLVVRERERAELLYNSSNLEILLNEKSEHLYLKLQDTKKVVQQLMDEFSANFVLYSYHIKKHSKNVSIILGDKLLDSKELARLSETDLYILSAASYLHDIGICIPNEDINKIYNEYKDNNEVYNLLEIEEYIREQHPYLSYNYIDINWEKLNLQSEWKDAIAMVAGMNKNIDIFEYEYFTYDPDGRRTKVCIPYLNVLIQLADMIDVENLNANYLLRNYEDNEEYKFSKKLWEETSCAITSRFFENRVLFNGECDDQLIYISLNRHIQEFKQKLEKLNSKVQKYKPELKFSISFIEENLNSSFSKKVGFSIDHNAIAEMLMGDNIYEDKYVAIREVIQNSIDSCNLKRKMNAEYLPEIEVELSSTELIVKDNALGMDEYIIKDYFSNLCRSYYRDNNLDSIGEFGIGVFSYFMLCDSFTVETKVKGDNTLKFKAYKNLQSYFYFYENMVSQINEGTIISLHLKEDIVKELTFEALVSTVRKYFKFLDTKIVLKCGDKREIIEKEEFKLDIEVELIDKIKYEERQNISDLKFLEAYINNNEFEGKCGIIFRNSSLCEYAPFYLGGILDHGPNRTNILVCQKGVSIIQGRDIYWRRGRIFDDLVIKINLKKKLNLNISRNNFTDKALDSIIYQFENVIINKFFQSIKELEPKIKCDVLDKFANHYINSYYFPYQDFKDLIFDNIYLYVYTGERAEYILLSELVHNNEQFIFISGKYAKLEDVQSKLPYNEIPIVYIKNEDLSRFCFQFFKALCFEFSISNYENGNLIINSRNKRDYKFFGGVDISIPFDNELLFSVVETLHLSETFYNSNHPFIQILLLNSKQIESNDQLYNKISKFFKFISNVHGYRPIEVSLAAINKYLDEIVSEFGKSIKITIMDFPEVHRKMIIE